MSWQCRLIDRKALNAAGEFTKPGDMFFQPAMVEGEHADYYRQYHLSPEYLRDWAGKRPPIVVCLPDGTWWNVDAKASRSDTGWTITGEAPRITARPSIMTESYHGWLTDGVLSDDLEGRSYT